MSMRVTCKKRIHPKIINNKGGDDDDATSTDLYQQCESAVGTGHGGVVTRWSGASVAIPFVVVERGVQK